MSDENSSHRSAVSQLADARKRALGVIHSLRADPAPSQHPNLVPVSETPHPLTEGSAAVADYLTHLRPYASTGEKWQQGLGAVEIPERITTSSPGLNRGTNGSYRCTRMPYVNIPDLGTVVRAANMTVIYSAAGSKSAAEFDDSTTYSYRVDGVKLTERGFGQYQSGVPLNECETVASDELNTDFEPATRSDDEQQYKFVFRPEHLLSVFEVADEIAASAELLADIDQQRDRDVRGL